MAVVKAKGPYAVVIVDPKTGNRYVAGLYNSRERAESVLEKHFVQGKATMGSGVADYSGRYYNPRRGKKLCKRCGRLPTFASGYCIRCWEFLRALGEKKTNPDGEGLYEEFHQASPKGLRKVEVPELPEHLIKIGKLEALIYQPEPPSRKAGAMYEHKFGDRGTMVFDKERPILATDPEGRDLFVIKGRSRYRFNRRGIVG